MSTPALPRFCPDCGQQFNFMIGLCGYRFLQALALQSSRVGVEIQCRYCQNMFVLSRTEPLRPAPKPRRILPEDSRAHEVQPPEEDAA